MKVEVDVTPEQAQYIAALIELWEIVDSDRPDFESGRAIRQLPGLIQNIALSLEMAPDFSESFSDIVDSVGWSENDRSVLSAVFSIATSRTLDYQSPQ